MGGVVVDGSLIEDVIAGSGAGELNIDSPDVGRSDDDDDDDVRRLHLAGPTFWVRTLESNISMRSLSDPLNMSTAQRNFVSRYYSAGGRRWRHCQQRLTCAR